MSENDARPVSIDEIQRLRDGIKALVGPPYTENSSDREHLRAEFAIEFAKEIEALTNGPAPGVYRVSTSTLRAAFFSLYGDQFPVDDDWIAALEKAGIEVINDG